MNLITQELCLASDIGAHGNLFGGAMVSWLDRAGAIAATTLCQSSKMVTIEMEGLKFIRKVKIGWIVRIYGEVESVGKTSIVLNLEARKYNIYTEEEKLVSSTRIIFVNVDEDGNKRPIDYGARANIKRIIKERENEENRGNIGES